MDDFSLVENVARAFHDYGFDAEFVSSSHSLDGELVLEKNGQRRVFILEVKRPLRLGTVREQGHRPEIIYVTDHVSTRTAEVLRRMRVHFIDAAGNAFLDLDDWFVDVRGRRRLEPLALSVVADAPFNLYSAKRAQVVFALLTWPELLGAPVRAVAEVAGVSLGIAQSTSNELRRRALWPDHQESRSTLIDGWAAAFPETLGRLLTIRHLRAEQFDQFYGDVLVSGEAAPSAGMRADSGVVYVDELSTELLMMNRWRTDGPSNLIVRRRFWSHPGSVSGEAPPLLVYGDLQASDDPRTRAVANEYRFRL